METLIIIGAKYLFLLSGIISVIYLFRIPISTRRKLILSAFLTFTLAMTLAITARSLYENPRPFVVGNFEPLIAHEVNNGFPSDHMLLVSAIAAVAYFFNKKLSILLWVIAILVGVSRMAAGVHHSLDIVGSALIALVSAAIVHTALKRWVRYNEL